MTKRLLLTAACCLTFAALGCDKSDDVSTSNGGSVDATPMSGDDIGRSMSEFEPYEDYEVFYVEADNTTYVVANVAARRAIQSGTPIPEGQSIEATDGAGNKIIFVDTGAVTAGDLMAGFERRNDLTLDIVE